MARRYETTIGGRIFGLLVGAVSSAMSIGAAWWAAQIFLRGVVSMSIGRGSPRGRVTLDGWLAYTYALGIVCLCAAFGLFAIAMLIATFSRSPRAAQFALSLLPWAARFFISAAGLSFLAVAIDVFG